MLPAAKPKQPKTAQKAIMVSNRQRSALLYLTHHISANSTITCQTSTKFRVVYSLPRFTDIGVALRSCSNGGKIRI